MSDFGTERPKQAIAWNVRCLGLTPPSAGAVVTAVGDPRRVLVAPASNSRLAGGVEKRKWTRYHILPPDRK